MICWSEIPKLTLTALPSSATGRDRAWYFLDWKMFSISLSSWGPWTVRGTEAHTQRHPLTIRSSVHTLILFYAFFIHVSFFFLVFHSTFALIAYSNAPLFSDNLLNLVLCRVYKICAQNRFRLELLIARIRHESRPCAVQPFWPRRLSKKLIVKLRAVPVNSKATYYVEHYKLYLRVYKLKEV